VVICLERGADLHMTQLMPLPLTVFCSSEIQIGFTFLVPAHLGSPRKGPLNGCVCVCVYNRTCKNDGVGVVNSLERGADSLHMVELMPLPSQTPIISCLIQISRLVSPFWYQL